MSTRWSTGLLRFRTGSNRKCHFPVRHCLVCIVYLKRIRVNDGNWIEREMGRMKRSVSLFFAFCSVLAVSAMPSRAELEKVQPIVKELMAGDLKAVKKGEKSVAEVASRAEELAGAADGEAAKFLLLNFAFNSYIDVREYELAANVVDQMRVSVKDVSDSDIVNLLRPAMKKLLPKSGGKLRLHLMYQAAQNSIAWQKKREAAEKSAVRIPLRYAQYCALCGDWTKALQGFKEAGGEEGKIALQELGEKKAEAGKIADFWWTYEVPSEPDAQPVFRRHAATWYKRALDANSLSGLMREIAAKRVAEMQEKPLEESNPVSASNAAAPAPVVAKGGKRLTFTGTTARLKLSDKVSIEFVKCPAGTFPFVVNGKGETKMVSISRPFWMARKVLSLEEVAAVMDIRTMPFGDRQQACLKDHPDYSAVVSEKTPGLCAKLTEMLRDELPQGYVVRSPSRAELEYAARAGKRRGTFYCDLLSNKKEQVEASPEYARFQVLQKDLSVSGNAKRDVVKNGWGIYNLLGDSEQTLDRYSRTQIVGQDRGYGMVRPIESQFSIGGVVDPFHNVEGTNFSKDTKILTWSWLGLLGMRVGRVSRLVIGPDLVGEWKAKQAGK
ncbi:MAG: hypothetical protein Q4G65_06030 [bacterium]|nr:hypothetical protein [bacterium]